MITTRDLGRSQRRRGGSIFALRHSPRAFGLGGNGGGGGEQAAPGGGPAPLPAWVGIGAGGYITRCSPSFSGSSSLLSREGGAVDFGGAGGILHNHPHTDVPPFPPDTPFPVSSQFNPVRSRTGNTLCSLHPTPRCPCFGAIQFLLHSKSWEQRPVGEGLPRDLHTAWRGPYCLPISPNEAGEHIGGVPTAPHTWGVTEGSFLYSPVELGVPTAPKGRFPPERGGPWCITTP